ncbi:MAG: fluoride efflux transporter CrcB [Gammaproteobacteria bacterium]
MNQWLAIALGGAAGAVARYGVSTAVYNGLGREFPWGTLAVNVIGSGAMGILFVLFMERMTVSPELRAGLLIGFLGAFTTFSTFSIETLNLMEAGEPLKALANALVSVGACVVATWGGVLLARSL